MAEGARPFDLGQTVTLAAAPSAGVSPRGRPVVLHVMEAFAGGTERHLIDLLTYATDVRHVIAVPSFHLGLSTSWAATAARAAGAQVELVEMGRFRDPRRQVLALRALRDAIERIRPDIVHGHSTIGGALARVATLGSDIPVVYTPHGISRLRWALVVERLLRSRTRRLIAVSDGERSFALSHGLARPEQALVIRNGVDPAPPAPLERSLRSELGLSEKVPLVGCIARLSWQKAPDMFVSACDRISQRLPAAHFVLIGSGPLGRLVDREIEHARLGNRFHRIARLPNAAAAFCELDVYALPSRFEGGPYTPLEAMRAGTPVVVTNVEGNRDLVEHELNGLVVPPENPAALAGAILRLLRDSRLSASLVDNAKQTVAALDTRTMAIRTTAVYREVLRSAATQSGQG